MIESPAPTSGRPPVVRGRSVPGLAPVLLLLALLTLVTACGATPPAAQPPVSTPATPTGAPAATSGPAPAPTGGTTAETLVWPVRDVAAATGLQRSVDGGSQPWLLDPAGVATSYAGAVLGYRNPRATQTGTGVVEVRDGTGPTAATITLTQPARRGDGGIWVVTGARRG